MPSQTSLRSGLRNRLQGRPGIRSPGRSPVRFRKAVALTLAALQFAGATMPQAWAAGPAAGAATKDERLIDNVGRVVREAQPVRSAGFPSPATSGLVLPDLGDPSVAELSPAAERRLGEQVMRQMRRDPDYLDDPLLAEYLNTLAHRLLNAARATGVAGLNSSGNVQVGAPSAALFSGFELFAVRDRNINAFALPGGYIGIHTALFAAAESESELASVLSHEIGHVTQRHIARMIGRQGQNSLLAIAGLLLAALAASRSPDAAQALALGGQALAMENQLSFSRSAEREADRIGYQILDAAGFDVAGMALFFQRLQRANAIRDANVPTYVRTHPLTIERVADMQDRARFSAAKPQTSGLEFKLMQARAQVLQGQAPDQRALLKRTWESRQQRAASAENAYGLALLALNEGDFSGAEKYLATARRAVGAQSPVAFAVLDIELARRQGRKEVALRLAVDAQQRFPLSRAVGAAQAEALLDADRAAEAVAFAQERTRHDSGQTFWWDLLARARAAANQRAGQHQALAERYALQGSWNAALDQLRIAREVGDADFFQLSEIDARTRELQRQMTEEMRERKK